MAPVVLIVDDEADLVSALQYTLQREGFDSRTAFDGTSALESCEALWAGPGVGYPGADPS